MAQADTLQRVVVVDSETNEQSSWFVKGSYILMYSGPFIQALMILVVSFVGYKWATTFIDYTGWAVRLGSAKSPEALLLRTQGWLIFATFFFMVVQIVGALLMPFNVKVGMVVSIAANVVPLLALCFVLFAASAFSNLNLHLDDLQRTVLWFQFWSVMGGFLLGLGARVAIMNGRKTTNLTN